MRLMITYPHIAARLGVKVRTVHRWRRRYNDMPEPDTCPNCGHAPVVSLVDTDQWLKATGRKGLR